MESFTLISFVYSSLCFLIDNQKDWETLRKAAPLWFFQLGKNEDFS